MSIAFDKRVAIPAAHAQEKVYLQVAWQYTTTFQLRLKVMPTALGRKTLNPFWPYWLRALVLQRTQPGLFSVEIQNKYVLISGGTSPGALEAVVTGLASQICPLPSVLKLDPEAPDRAVHWEIRQRRQYIPFGMIVDALQVPPGVTVSFNRWQYFDDQYPSRLAVICRHNDKRSMRELRLSIELQVALMCK